MAKVKLSNRFQNAKIVIRKGKEARKTQRPYYLSFAPAESFIERSNVGLTSKALNGLVAAGEYLGGEFLYRERGFVYVRFETEEESKTFIDELLKLNADTDFEYGWQLEHKLTEK